jgi:putative ABC transport system permease protein
VKLHQVVLKDIQRRKKRVLYTSFGVVIGITTLVAILTVAMAGQAKIYEELNKYGPNMVVTPAISDVGMKVGDLDLGNIAVGDNYIDESRIPEIRVIADDMIRETVGIRDPGPIATIAPKLYVNTEINGREIMLIGISPGDELLLKNWWEMKDGSYLQTDVDVIVGSEAAAILGLGIGDSVQIGTEEGWVTGILKETGSADDYQVFAPLATVQKGFGKEGKVSALEIRALCQACPVEDISGKLNEAIPGVRAVAVKQIAKNEMSTMERLNRFMLTLAVVTLLVGSLGVINTMLTTVHERTKDIGIMKAVGASRYQVMAVFTYEAVIVGFVGGLAGYALGSLGAYIIGPLVFEGVRVNAVLGYLPLSLGVAVVVTVGASVYPSYRASKIKVADSFRAL